MDGYALRAADLTNNKSFPVVGFVRAGDDGGIDVPQGACCRIATGAPIPEGLDAVIEHERSDLASPVRFSLETIEPGRSLHARGADAHAGATLVPSGSRLNPAHCGLAATVGACSLSLARTPRTLVVTSGDELIGPEGTPAPHQLREGNGTLLASMLWSFNVPAVDRTHLADDREATEHTLKEALDTHELLITIGGISAGEHDFIRPVFESLGVQWTIARADIRPGKPVHIGRRDDTSAVVVCLPGNPVSALVCAHLFLPPILGAFSGANDHDNWHLCTLAADIRPDRERTCFRPAQFEANQARVPRWQGSGDFAHLAECNGMVELPCGDEMLSAGTVVRALRWQPQ